MYLSKLALSAVFVLGVSTSYANCIKDICVNNTVIDDYNYVGVVKSIDLDKKTVSYKRQGYPSLTSTSANELSPKINSNEFKVNTFLIDDYNYVGKILNAFKDGRVQYKREGYNSSTISKDVSPEIGSKGNIRKGQIVIDTYNYTGKTLKVFKNGKIQYVRDGYSSSTISDDITARVEAIKLLKSGVRVIDGYNYTGVVKNVFEDGRVQYIRDGYSSSTISKELTAKVDSIKGIQSKTTIIDAYNYVGNVVEVFEDGRISYKRDGYSSATISSELVAESLTAINGLEKGKRCVDSYNYLGTVQTVFKDGRVQYKRKKSSSSTISSELSVEVETHEKYNKETEYAVDRFIFGKPSMFFANGKAYIEARGSSRVTDILYPEVSDVLGLVPGDEIILPSIEKVKIKKLFANGVAKYEGKDNDLLAKIVDVNENKRQLEYEINRWIQYAIQYNNYKKTYEGDELKSLLAVYNITAVTQSDYERLVEIISEYVQDNRRKLGLSKKEVQEVIAYYSGDIVQDDTAPSDTQEVVDYQIVVNDLRYVQDIAQRLNNEGITYKVVDTNDVNSELPVLDFSYTKRGRTRTCALMVKTATSTMWKTISKTSKKTYGKCLNAMTSMVRDGL